MNHKLGIDISKIKPCLTFRIFLLSLILISAIGAPGCSSHHHWAEQPAPLVEASEAATLEGLSALDRPLQHGTADLDGYVRTAQNELDIRFPLLPNPTIVLFIFPHVADEAPIPGYATTFKLYQKDHYALPGER